MHGGKQACEPFQRKVVSTSATMRFPFGRENFFRLIPCICSSSFTSCRLQCDAAVEKIQVRREASKGDGTRLSLIRRVVSSSTSCVQNLNRRSPVEYVLKLW
jgi:hypothetical protein